MKLIGTASLILLACTAVQTALPVYGQSWSSWKQIAEEQMSKGQLPESESSWQEAYRLIEESSAGDPRVYITALGLAKTQIALKKTDQARKLLHSVCKLEQFDKGALSQEQAGCLREYLELIKTSEEDKPRVARIEHLLEGYSPPKEPTTQTGGPAKPAPPTTQVVMLFGEAADTEMRRKVASARLAVQTKDYDSAAKELSDALMLAEKSNKPDNVILVLTERSTLYATMNDYSGAETTYKKVVALTSQNFGSNSQKYADALHFHAKLMRRAGNIAGAAKEDLTAKSIEDKLSTPAVASSEAPPKNTPQPTAATHFDPSSIAVKSISRPGLTLKDLMNEADKTTTDIALLKFVSKMLYDSGEYNACIPYVKKFVALEPGNPAGHSFLAEVFIKADHPNEAIAPGKIAYSLQPTAENYSYLIAIYSNAGDMENHLSCLKDFINKYPGDKRIPRFQQELAHLEAATKESSATESSAPTELEIKKSWVGRASMPLKVHLIDNAVPSMRLIFKDGSGGRAPGVLCREALDSWSSASGGRVAFTLVPNQSEAQIIIGYVHQTDKILSENCAAGVTTWPAGTAGQAVVYLGLVGKDGHTIWRDEFYATALHEIGHALGLEHSKRPEDTMFWQEHSVKPTAPSANDQRRIVSLYSR